MLGNITLRVARRRTGDGAEAAALAKAHTCSGSSCKGTDLQRQLLQACSSLLANGCAGRERRPLAGRRVCVCSGASNSLELEAPSMSLECAANPGK